MYNLKTKEKKKPPTPLNAASVPYRITPNATLRCHNMAPACITHPNTTAKTTIVNTTASISSRQHAFPLAFL